MAYGNQRRRHGNVYYAGKYAARAAGAVGAYYSGTGSTKWGWKKGGKVYKRLLGGIRGPRARLTSNRSRTYNTGSNRGPRLGSNPSKRKVKYTSFSTPKNYHGGGRAFQKRYKY